MRPALLLLAALLLSPATFAAEDYELARREYADLVRDRLDAETLTEADVEKARVAVRALVETAHPQVLDTLSVDAGRTAARILKLALELEDAHLRLQRIKEKLAKPDVSDRAAVEEEARALEKRTAELEALLPQLRAVRAALQEGLLDITEKAAEVEPEAIFKLLVAYFETDTNGYYQLEQEVRQGEASLASVRERLPALAADEEAEKARLEDAEARVAAELDEKRAALTELGRLKDRRIAVLGTLFPRLPAAVQAREQKAIQANLRDDVRWETRAVYSELLGQVPAEGTVEDLLQVMRRASRNNRDLTKEIEPLREVYDRALKAVTTQIAGSGVVYTDVLATKDKAEKELQAASARAYGEARVLESSAAGLGHALALTQGERRQKALDTAIKLIDKEQDPEVRVRVVDALGRVDEPPVRQRLRELAGKSADLRLRLAALDSLARLADEDAVELAITALLRDAEWRVRAAAMRFLVQVPRKNAVPALIESIGAEVGRLVDDAEQALVQLTGKTFHGDAALWREWWAANKESFELGGPPAQATAEAEKTAAGKDIPGHVSFYGISTRSKRILFVLDRSGSMNEPVGKGETGPGVQKKIDAAKAQLKAALAGLADGDLYNIITYAVDVERWQKKMVKTTNEQRKKTVRYVDSIQAVGGTNIYDALEQAFRLAGIGAMDKAYESNVDTIFFLTDGQPTAGEVQDPAEILRRVKEWNRLARIVVHTVGVGLDHDAAFLRRLAEENGGQYVSR